MVYIKDIAKGVLLRKPFFAVAAFCIAFLIINASSCLYAAEISSKDFLSSEFAKSFRNKEYKKALEASDSLLAKYP